MGRATTTKQIYKDAGQGWEYEGTNYMRNKFDVDNVQYEKFAAEMPKKMDQAKPKSTP
jgi:hypothetical protein